MKLAKPTALGLAAAATLGLAACGSSHSAAWQTGYNEGVAYAQLWGWGRPGVSGFRANDIQYECNSELNNMPSPVSASQQTDYANGFLAGCEKVG